MLEFNLKVTWENFKILGMESNHQLLEIKKSYLLKGYVIVQQKYLFVVIISFVVLECLLLLKSEFQQ